MLLCSNCLNAGVNWKLPRIVTRPTPTIRSGHCTTVTAHWLPLPPLPLLSLLHRRCNFVFLFPLLGVQEKRRHAGEPASLP